MPLAQNPTTSRPRVPTALACAVLFVGTVLLFSRALSSDFVILDDPVYVTDNPQVRSGLSWHGLAWAFTAPSANWHPLTWLSHMLDWQVYGPAPWGHHLTSVLWHALNAALAFLVFRRLGGGFWLSSLAAAVFAWHPLRAESVAWIAERKDVMSGCFFLLTILAYTRYVERRRTGQTAWRSYALTAACFLGGLMSKPMVVTLPLLLLVLDAWPLRRLASARDLGPLVLEKLPFFVLSGAVAVVTVLMQHGEGAFVLDVPLDARAGNAVVSIVRYLGKFFGPFGLIATYPHPGYWPGPIVAGSVVLVGAVSVLAWMQRAARPWIAAGWLWFLITLVPVLGLLQVGVQAMADRYSYLPLLGIEWALFWTVAPWCSGPRRRRIASGAGAAVLLGLGVRAWDQVGTWHDSVALFQHAVDVAPGDVVSECHLASALVAAGRLAEAAEVAERARQRDPASDTAMLTLADVRTRQRRLAEAIELYDAAVAVRPDNAMARLQLGLLQLIAGQPAEAHRQLVAALRARPALHVQVLGLGHTARQQRDPASAYFYYRVVLAADPGDVEAHIGLGAVLLGNGDRARGLTEWRRALELDPDYPELRERIEAAEARP